MKSYFLNKNSLALSIVFIITVGFFIAGLLDVLDYFIIKALLFVSFGALFIIALVCTFKNEDKKNRPKA